MEVFVIILLAGTCLWLGWKLIKLRRGIRSITAALDAESLPERNSLYVSARRGSLARLSNAVFDSVTEADFQRSLETGRREVLDFVLNQIENSLFIVDAQQQIRYSNRAAHELFSSESEHEGSQLIEICLDHRIVETVALALETGTRMQDRITLANSSKTLLVEAELIDPNHPLGPGVWLLIRDITAELQTEQVRKDFVANASHELRTPLSIIKGHLEMLEDDLESNTFKVLSKHTERIADIVEDMLTISKLERSDPDDRILNREEFDLGDCIRGIVEQLQPLIDEHGTKVSIELPDEKQCQYYGDRFHFDQIFFNLIENALKQNRKKGLKIIVRVSREESDQRFLIDVVDNGVGIPSSAINDVFKRFYRVEKHHSQTVKGTGLGLSIVKRAVEAHHGSVSVESQPGERTCFQVSLPAEQM